MRFNSFSKLARVVVLFAIGLTALSTWAQHYKVLYSFTGGADGALPIGSLILDGAGNIYGTAAGNLYGVPKSGTTAGSVFMISPKGKFTLLHNFGAGGAEGAWPAAALVRDSAGNLYGTASGGGSSDNGTVFKVDSSATFTLLHDFAGGKDGAEPFAPMIFDRAGNLWGTTVLGGSPGCSYKNPACGTIFRIDASGKEKVIKRFSNWRKYGDGLFAPLMMDSAGNLYGSASDGGAYNGGTLFKLDITGNMTILHTFTIGPDGLDPRAGLIEDAAGNLYGTTGGGVGTVYKLDTAGSFNTFFLFGGSSGTDPFLSGMIMDAAGNFYGTTYSGGSQNPCNAYDPGCGVVYKLDPSGNQTVLYQFSGGKDGANPESGVIMDAAGNLYGTAVYGGKVNSNCPAGCGVVFKITP